MGWEMRRGKRVYYRKVREGRRVRSVYCGTGERGEQAAREDAARRAARLRSPVGAAVELPPVVAPSAPVVQPERVAVAVPLGDDPQRFARPALAGARPVHPASRALFERLLRLSRDRQKRGGGFR